MTPTKPRLEDCPHCEDGKAWTSKYGGNDPDVWAVPCKHCDGTGKVEVEEEADDAEPGVLSELWETVNALGGYRPAERNYDQGFVDGIAAALAEIEKAQSEAA